MDYDRCSTLSRKEKAILSKEGDENSTMALNDSFYSSNLLKSVDILCVIPKEFASLIKCCNESVAEGRLELARVDFLKENMPQN